jgi:hypothetical protein
VFTGPADRPDPVAQTASAPSKNKKKTAAKTEGAAKPAKGAASEKSAKDSTKPAKAAASEKPAKDGAKPAA